MGLPIPFARWTTYSGHSGVDFPEPRGTVFRASGHGYVRGVAHSARGGYYMYVKYDGYPAVGYHHMDSPSPYVKAGTEVWEGTPLGKVGSLGQNSTGPHLHSEVEGRASAAGYWTVFDRNRVVGSGSGTGGGSTPTPEPTPDPFLLEDDMIRIQAADRGIALIGPGYYRALGSDEEVNASGVLVTKHLTGNAREFDLWKSMALDGQASLPNVAPIADAVVNRDIQNPAVAGSLAAFVNQTNAVVLGIRDKGVKADVAVDYEKLAAAIAAKLPADAKVDVNAVAKAVRAEFKSNPLS